MRIGLLGASQIAPRAIIEPASEIQDAEVVAVAARDATRARAFAATYNIPVVYASYESLINDDSLDAVYVGLPTSLHYEWSIAALEAGRHVLCEKPLCLNAAQARTMVATANGASRQLVEAFHWRYHPLAARMIQLSSQVGPLVRGEGRFDASPPPQPNFRLELALGGGATMDLGCYAVHWLRTLSAEEPNVLRASGTLGPTGVDVSMTATLQFPSGMEAELSCSMIGAEKSLFDGCLLSIEGRDGELRVRNPMAPQFGHQLTARLADGTKIEEVLDGRSSYLFQLEAFLSVIAGHSKPLTGGNDSIANMTVIDAIYEASGVGVRR